MRQMIPSKIFLVMFASLLGVECFAESSRCGRMTVPLNLDASNKVFQVTGSWISTNDDGGLEGRVSLTNITGKSLSQLAIMVNYLDENRSVLFSIPYQASASTTDSQPVDRLSFSLLKLREPVRPGQVVAFIGRNLITAERVPESAELVYWHVKYEDGTSDTASTGHRSYRTDPRLVETPGYLRLKLPHRLEPTNVFVKLHISEHGSVLDIDGNERGPGLTEEQFQTLAKELSAWHFFPAVENGYAVQSDLYLLLEFRPENAIAVRGCLMEFPVSNVNKFGFVTLQPISDSSDRWIPYYGGFPAAGKMQVNIIETGPPAKPLD